MASLPICSVILVVCLVGRLVVSEPPPWLTQPSDYRLIAPILTCGGMGFDRHNNPVVIDTFNGRYVVFNAAKNGSYWQFAVPTAEQVAVDIDSGRDVFYSVFSWPFVAFRVQIVRTNMADGVSDFFGPIVATEYGRMRVAAGTGGSVYFSSGSGISVISADNVSSTVITFSSVPCTSGGPISVDGSNQVFFACGLYSVYKHNTTFLGPFVTLDIPIGNIALDPSNNDLIVYSASSGYQLLRFNSSGDLIYRYYMKYDFSNFAVDQDGNLATLVPIYYDPVCIQECVIYRYDKFGVQLPSYSIPLKLSTPLFTLNSIAFDANDHSIYVSNIDRVQQLSLPHGFEMSLYTNATTSKFYRQTYAAVDAASNLYIVDTYNHRILKFNQQKQLVREFYNPPFLTLPNTIATARHPSLLGDFYVVAFADNNSTWRIIRYNATTDSLSDVTPRNVIRTDIVPSICTDVHGHVYITFGPTVYKYDPDFKTELMSVSIDQDIGALTVDFAGHYYVAPRNNNFNYNKSAPAIWVFDQVGDLWKTINLMSPVTMYIYGLAVDEKERSLYLVDAHRGDIVVYPLFKPLRFLTVSSERSSDPGMKTEQDIFDSTSVDSIVYLIALLVAVVITVTLALLFIKALSKMSAPPLLQPKQPFAAEHYTCAQSSPPIDRR